MHVDHLTLACLRDRLDGLLGARVQRVILPDDLSLGLELYAGERIQLLISAHPQHARMLVVPQKQRRGVERPTPLLQLMRKWVRGSRLVDVSQPPWERILVLHFEGQVGPCQLVAELIDHYSNVILVGPDGNVLEAVKRIGADQNRYRVTLPAHPYEPPPKPPGRQPPTGITANEWAALLTSADSDEPLHRLLTRRLFGVSPTAAREVAARSAGDPQAPTRAVDPGTLAKTITELFSPLEDGSWAPHVALDEGDNVSAFAPYELRQFERIEQEQSISSAMWRYFRQRLTADAYAAARGRVRTLIDDARSRVEHTLQQLEIQKVDQGEVETLREIGELLLTYQGEVEPGAREITLPDYKGNPRTIKLDPALTPVENAQTYFRRYRKAARAAEKVPARIAALSVDRDHLEQLAADLALAESRPEIDAVRAALAEAGWTREPRRRSAGQVEGPRHFEAHGFDIYVGRNAHQNEHITFERAGPDDLWLHVRGWPGAHVIVKSGGQEVPEQVVQRAAELAAYYSSARGSRQVGVDVTERRFVRRARGGHPGLVNYRNEQTVWAKATIE
ncbi:MAG: NFACT RNA binding domain-containing protein [Anaerolineae bacterium]|jgi:predicted ribosome quality control (RQC) complex YloA/Tae2 family protein